MPPCSRNHLVPTTGDTPAILAASSLEQPATIAFQNGRRSARCKTGGRPGDRSFARPVRLSLALTATSNREVLRRPIEFALAALVAVVNQARGRTAVQHGHG